MITVIPYIVVTRLFGAIVSIPSLYVADNPHRPYHVAAASEANGGKPTAVDVDRSGRDSAPRRERTRTRGLAGRYAEDHARACGDSLGALRADLRFHALLRRMNFPETAETSPTT